MHVVISSNDRSLPATIENLSNVFTSCFLSTSCENITDMSSLCSAVKVRDDDDDDDDDDEDGIVCT